MKCMANAVMYQRRENRLSTEYGYWMLEWCDTVIGVTLAENHGFGLKRLQQFYDETRNGLSDKMASYMPERIFVDKGRGREKGDIADRMNDGVDTTLDVITKELAYIGVDRTRLDELEPEKEFSGKTRRDILTHAARVGWYESNGRRAIKLYVAYLMTYMNERHGFGKKRLNELLDSVNPMIQKYLTDFLKGNYKLDNEMKAELDRMHDRLAIRGLEFEEMPEEDTVRVRSKSTESTPPICALNELDKYNEIMTEVKKQNMRRYR